MQAEDSLYTQKRKSNLEFPPHDDFSSVWVKAQSDYGPCKFQVLTLAGALCSSHHGISAGTNCSGRGAEASEQNSIQGRELCFSAMEGEGEVCVWGILNTSGNYVVYAGGITSPPLQLWPKENIYCRLFSHLPFSLCQSKILQGLCLCTLNPGCVRCKECAAGGRHTQELLRKFLIVWQRQENQRVFYL